MEGTNIGALLSFFHRLQAIDGPDARIEIRHGSIVHVRNSGRDTWGVYSLSDVSKSVDELRAEMHTGRGKRAT